MAGQILQDQSFGAKHPLVREVGGATRQREMAPHHGFVRSYQCLTCLRWASACVNRSGLEERFTLSKLITRGHELPCVRKDRVGAENDLDPAEQRL